MFRLLDKDVLDAPISERRALELDDGVAYQNPGAGRRRARLHLGDLVVVVEVAADLCGERAHAGECGERARARGAKFGRRGTRGP